MIVHQPHNSLGNYSYNAFFYDDCEWFYHFHKNYELIYVLDGEVELTLGSQKMCLQADSFAIVLPNQFHAYRTPQHSRVWIAVFSADFVGEFAKLTEGKQAADPRFTCNETVKAYLLSALITESTPDLLSMKSLLYAACAAFLTQVQLVDKGGTGELVGKVIQYVQTHYAEDMTFIRMAEALGYEYHYLSRRFRQHFGMHFRQFLNMYRMEQAQQLLLDSTTSITDVAYGVGFQNLRTFNRVFAQHMGMTPSEFRATAPRSRQQRQNSDGSFYYSD
jgi:AraC-like DNA-binding protein